MRQLIYISGRGHSGSTLLDLMLSGHPRLIGVGEVFSLFDPERNFLNLQGGVNCSCGKLMEHCDFWSPTSDLLRPAYERKMGMQELYRIFLSSFYDYFGSDAIPVDISKTDEALQVLKNLTEINLKVIFLIRDVRSWVVSMRDNARRAREFEISDLIKRFGWKAWKPYTSRTSIKFYWHWYLLNRRTQRFLHESGLPHIQVGYEELCLQPEFMLRTICAFLDLGYTEDMLSLGDAQSHVILGNRMRTQKEKRRRVSYDNRWFYRPDWMLPAFLFPNIMRYNSLQVYQHTHGFWNT